MTGIRNPLMRGGLSRGMMLDPRLDRPVGPDESWDSPEVGPSFFETMSIPRGARPHVHRRRLRRGAALVIVNEAFASTVLPE